MLRKLLPSEPKMEFSFIFIHVMVKGKHNLKHHAFIKIYCIIFKSTVVGMNDGR